VSTSPSPPPTLPPSSASSSLGAGPGALGLTSDALVAALFTQSPLSVALYDTTGHVAAGNAAYERHFGVRVADVPVEWSLRTDPQLAAAGMLPLVERAYAGEAVTLPAVRYDAAEATGGAGRAVWTQGHCYPVRDAAGQVTHVAVVHVDVTAWAEAEAARAAASARLEGELAEHAAVLGQLAEGVIVADAAGRITFMNAAAERLHGVARLEVSPEAYAESYHLFTEDGRAYPSTELPLARAVLGGETVTDARWRIRRPDGSEIVAAGSARPLVGPDGARLGAVLTVRDDTARAAVDAAEAALGEQVRLLRTMSENATLALFIMDAQQRCTYMNPAAERLTGFALGELQGQALHYYVHHTRPDGTPYPLEECPIDQALPQNEREQGTEMFVHKDGSFYPVAFTASPIRDPATGVPVGTIIEVRGIAEEVAAAAERERLLTDSEAARRAAEAANAAKSQFLSTMSHELRTPLNAIGGYVDLLTLGLRGPLTEAQRQDLERIRLANQHLMSLVTDVLNFARLDAGQIEFRLADVELASVVAHLEPLMMPQLVAKGIRFDHDGCAPDTPDQPHRLRADPEKLRQILLNLLTNALKFTDAGGRVALACETDAEAGTIRVRVTDTGRGIPSHQLDRIFDPFVQVDRHRTHESQQGVGLGLAISRDLARGMGGNLTVESTLGVGSTFTLTLPRAAP
jgi:PAS domain S-box-containing protein